jgi:hypothetical protein
MRRVLLAIIVPLFLGGCFSYESPPPQHTTVVVPPGSTVVCPSGAAPPC